MKIMLEEATVTQLRDFVSRILQVEGLKGNENKNMLIAKMEEVGYKANFILLDDDVPTPAARGNGPIRYTEGEGENLKVRIIIPSVDKPGGHEPVPVGVNGRMMLIPRDKPVMVPEPYVKVLENAEEFVYDEYDPNQDEGRGGLREPRVVKSYPFQYA